MTTDKYLSRHLIGNNLEIQSQTELTSFSKTLTLHYWLKRLIRGRRARLIQLRQH